MPLFTTVEELAAAFEPGDHELISLVGGGGKTTTLFGLGHQLAGTRVLTTTTKMGAEQTGELRTLVDPTDDELAEALALDAMVLTWKDTDGRRAVGFEPETCDRWFAFADHIVVEADGSRKRPFKAPLEYEPVVPSATTLLVACIGISAFGRPIADSCHRSERVAALAGCTVDDLLTPARAAAVLRSADGSQKGRPEGARYFVAVHRTGPEHQGLVHELEEALDGIAPVVAVAEHG